MLEKIRSSLRQSYEQESLLSRMTRIRFGILIGFIGATFFMVSSALINVISYPQLNIGVDWNSLLVRWLSITVAIMVAAAIAGWPTESYVGVVGGGTLMTVILLIVNIAAVLTNPDSGQSIAKAVVSTLPMIGACILLALALRVVMNKYLKITQEEKPSARRKHLMKIIGIAILVGLIPGIFSRFDFSTIQTLNTLTTRLKSAEITDIEYVRFPQNVTDEVTGRYGTGFTIYPHLSSAIISFLDTTIEFDDGYTVTCLLPTDASQFLVIDFCEEGKDLTIQK